MVKCLSLTKENRVGMIQTFTFTHPQRHTVLKKLVKSKTFYFKLLLGLKMLCTINNESMLNMKPVRNLEWFRGSYIF